MQRPFTVRGVPPKLIADGWWLSTTPEDKIPTPRARKPSGLIPRSLSLVALVLLADFLFWEAELGISVALFTAAIFAFAVLDGALRYWWRPAVLLALSTLPVINYLQPLSFGYLVIGLLAALVWARHPDASKNAIARSAARFLSRLPSEWIARLNPSVPIAAIGPFGTLRKHLRNWGFPMGGGLVIFSLLLQANPVLADFLTLDIDLWEGLRRGIFWAGVVLLVSPLLAPLPLAMASPLRAFVLPSFGLNQGSVLRALVIFNLLIGLQTVVDLSILLGGATLPSGMTLAEFAHRGAYPLLATAILAGAFALAARPFLSNHRLIRPLLLLWLGQNVILAAAAALRLELYIESFSLTYLRLYALIWMAMVAVGLGLIFWQVLRDKGNSWLILHSVGLGAATLYICSFINFAQVIAAQNVGQPDPDRYYLCSLGPLAVGPILESGLGTVRNDGIFLGDCSIGFPHTGDWREWGFRTWAATRYGRVVTIVERPR